MALGDPDGPTSAVAVAGGTTFGHRPSGPGGRYDGPQFARVQCDIIRDVFGNPFRPVEWDLSWRSTTAIDLARSMYDGRDFSPMPILADALEDAGCDDPNVLAHCRSDGSHVRGCWVIDSVLGKT